MKKLGKKNLEGLNTVEAYASRHEYDNCTSHGIESCGYNWDQNRHMEDNNSRWTYNFKDVNYYN